MVSLLRFIKADLKTWDNRVARAVVPAIIIVAVLTFVLLVVYSL